MITSPYGETELLWPLLRPSRAENPVEKPAQHERRERAIQHELAPAPDALGSGTSEWPSATQRIGVAFRATRCFAGHWKRAPMTLKLAREVLHMVRARLVVWIS